MSKRTRAVWALMAAAALVMAPLAAVTGCDMEALGQAPGGGGGGTGPAPGGGGGGTGPKPPQTDGSGPDGAAPEDPDNPGTDGTDPPRPPGGMTTAERNSYEQAGHFLKLYHLPAGASGDRVSAVRVTDSFAQIAGVDPAVTPMPVYHESAEFTDVYVPLTGPDNTAFTRTGTFLIDSLQVTFDFEITIIIRPEHQIYADFVQGRATLDLYALMWQRPEIVDGVLKGYFSGGLTNPADAAAPLVKSGTIFEMNGEYHRVTANTAVTHANPFQTGQKTQLLYIYARKHTAGTVFEYLDTDPAYVPEKKGWYSGSRRALYKLVYIRDDPDKYVAKTFITDDFAHFDRFLVNNAARSNIPAFHYFLSGSGDPPPRQLALQKGVYLLELSGAGGGGSANNQSNVGRSINSVGGSGGYAAELVILTSDVSFDVFCGQGGGHSEAITLFEGRDGYYTDFNNSAGGGGGGGAGSFAYSEDGYLLCAGGGGGGGGCPGSLYSDSVGTPGAAIGPGGGGGGAGGGLGPGGGGGAGGFSSSLNGTGGGAGGGYGGGGRGIISTAASIEGGYAGSAYGPANRAGFGGANGNWAHYDHNSTAGGPGGQAAYCHYDEIFESAQAWKNTNNANGAGGRGGQVEVYSHITLQTDGGSGGNNRNGSRGGGGPGGTPGNKGGDGFIRVFKVY